MYLDVGWDFSPCALMLGGTLVHAPVNMHFRCGVWQAQIMDVIPCDLLQHPCRLQDH